MKNIGFVNIFRSEFVYTFAWLATGERLEVKTVV